MEYFNYCQGLTMTSRAFHELFGGPPRKPESSIEQRHMDLAASIQAVTEEVVLRDGPRRSSRDRHDATWCWPAAWRSTAWPTAGCCARGRSTTSGSSRPPATPAARWARRCSSGISCSTSRARPTGRDRQKGSLLGPALHDRGDLRRSSTTWACRITAPSTTSASCSSSVADLLAEEKIVGWFQGRMEFGPRALGARSILGDPRSPRMQATMNLKIKFRESFRPFAPCVLQDEAHGWFDLEPGQESPYMLLVAPVRDEHRVPIDGRPARDDGERSGPAESREHPAVDDPGGHARRLQRAGPDRG